MALRDIALLWRLARRIETVFENAENATRGLEKVRDEVRALEKRVAKLEGNEELLVEKARSASAVAASTAVTQHLVDMSRRIGALEERSSGPHRLE
jgi:cell division protein FtsB